MSAELNARRTAAAALAADFRRALGTSPPGAGHGMYYWALRLADMLGLVLNALDEAGPAVTLDDDQAATALSALEDASEGIRERAAYCSACKAHPAELCPEDEDRLSRAEAYDALATELRRTVQ